MKTSSCKSKGRNFQQKIRDMYRTIGKVHGLVDADIESRGMGQQGEDIIFSPRAKELTDHSIECKKHRRVVVPRLFKEHFDKYKDTPSLKLLFHSNNNAEALVTLQAKEFLSLVERLLKLEEETQT